MKGFITGIALTLLVSVFGWERVAGVLDALDAAGKHAMSALEDHPPRHEARHGTR